MKILLKTFLSFLLAKWVQFLLLSAISLLLATFSKLSQWSPLSHPSPPTHTGHTSLWKCWGFQDTTDWPIKSILNGWIGSFYWGFKSFLDMINVISAADITFIMSSSTSAWLLSPLECSRQKQNGWTLRFCLWIMWKMYNKTIIEFGFRMISWIIKTSCLCNDCNNWVQKLHSSVRPHSNLKSLLQMLLKDNN